LILLSKFSHDPISPTEREKLEKELKEICLTIKKLASCFDRMVTYMTEKRNNKKIGEIIPVSIVF